MIWVLFGVMLAAAALVVAWPLYRRERRLSPWLVSAVGSILILSAALYSVVGTPVAPLASVDEMMASLERRLDEQPDDLDGWKMLGRSYFQLADYPQAIAAFERAVELESASNAQTLADLGEAVLNHDNESITGRAGQLFENAVAIAPGNQKALFYAGIAAAARGDEDRAAGRWEALLAQAPPPEIQSILREGIAAWRGETTTAPAAPAGDGTVVEVNVSLGADARAAVGADATVFIIARDPLQPSPPIAAVRRKASELPLTVPLGDADAMMPGRLISAFDRVEIVARASVSGQPRAQAGDWYGQQTIALSGAAADTGAVDIVIEQRVQ